MNDFSSGKYTINYGALKAFGNGWTFVVPPTWGSVIMTFPLADIETIDARVENMTEFPEVLAILKNL